MSDQTLRGGPKAAAMAKLNDAFRARPGAGWRLTSGVFELGVPAVAKIVAAVRAFDRFEEGDDPYGERDFGTVEVDGRRLFWKIDYYDKALSAASPDPADAGVTRRILTIMLAEEY